MGTEVTTATFHPCGNIPAVPGRTSVTWVLKVHSESQCVPCVIGLSRPSLLRAHLPLRPHWFASQKHSWQRMVKFQVWSCR